MFAKESLINTTKLNCPLGFRAVSSDTVNCITRVQRARLEERRVQEGMKNSKETIAAAAALGALPVFYADSCTLNICSNRWRSQGDFASEI